MNILDLIVLICIEGGIVTSARLRVSPNLFGKVLSFKRFNYVKPIKHSNDEMLYAYHSHVDNTYLYVNDIAKTTGIDRRQN